MEAEGNRRWLGDRNEAVGRAPNTRRGPHTWAWYHTHPGFQQDWQRCHSHMGPPEHTWAGTRQASMLTRTLCAAPHTSKLVWPQAKSDNVPCGYMTGV